jgi:hypothetical protein
MIKHLWLRELYRIVFRSDVKKPTLPLAVSLFQPGKMLFRSASESCTLIPYRIVFRSDVEKTHLALGRIFISTGKDVVSLSF